MKKIFALPLLLFTLCCAAQMNNSTLLLHTERAFATYSVAHGTKAAFLKFLDSTGIVFEKGEMRNGIATWQKRNDGGGLLNWQPVYGFVAASGELGFTTGPWTFQPKSITDSIIARGQYTTLWKKNSQGEWKAILDMGVRYTTAFDLLVDSLTTAVRFVPGTWNNLLNREQKFMQQTAIASVEERSGVYAAAVSSRHFFLNRNGRRPAENLADCKAVVQLMPPMISYRIEGSGISAAGDLGYVYGTTIINNKTDNYLRIWRREGKEWKLALEVLPY